MQKLIYAFCVAWILLTHSIAGTVEGKISLPVRPEGRIPVEKYVGSISGKVGPPPRLVAGVWIEGIGISAPATPTTMKMPQRGYQFTNSLMIVPRGTTILFPNEDADYHNVFSLSRTARFDLGRYKKDEPEVPQYTFKNCGVVRLQCEIHQHMKANMLVVESPHCTTTDAEGNFSLSGLPSGQWMLRVQLDEKTQWHTPVRIGSGKTNVSSFIAGPPPVIGNP
jgi:plastocyanin